MRKLGVIRTMLEGSWHGFVLLMVSMFYLAAGSAVFALLAWAWILTGLWHLIVPSKSKGAGMSCEAFEECAADRLADKGFYNIRLTPGSSDYGVDILAEKGGVKFAFQCKRYKSPVGVKAVQEIYAGCRKYCMEQPVVVTNSSFTQNAKTLANDLGVSLWELEMFDAIF